jgi:hypothetical protein
MGRMGYPTGAAGGLFRPINPTLFIELNVDAARFKIRHKARVTVRHNAIPVCIVAGITDHHVPIGDTPSVIGVWPELKVIFAEKARYRESRF